MKLRPSHKFAPLRGRAREADQGLPLLGPSACGKTTVLRLLAGLVAPDRGRIDINGEVVAKDGRNLREPQERNLGMVFQDLALWPHLTVRGNLEFGLKAQGVPAPERQRRVWETLEVMQLQSYAEAWPAGLSGGSSNAWHLPGPWCSSHGSPSAKKDPAGWWGLARLVYAVRDV